MENLFGEEKAKLAADSHTTAIEWIARTVNREHIDCHFKKLPGYLFLHTNDVKETLEKEYDATRRTGLPTRMLNETPG